SSQKGIIPMPKVFKKSIVHYLDADGRQVPKGTPGARRVKEKSAKWYGRVPGNTKPVPLSPNKVVAQQMLAALVNKDSLEKVHGPDPFAPHRARPLSEHVEDYERVMLAKGDCAEHADKTIARVRAILSGCRFAFIPDLSASAVAEFLHGLRRDPSRPEL